MESDRDVVFIDSSVLISCGRRESTRFQALAREARQRDTVFRISPQVYAEVTGDPALTEYTADEAAVDEALQKDVMDQARSFIASASDRTEDAVEKADTEIVGLALEMLLNDTADRITIVTNDIPLAEAAESLLPQYGFDSEQIA